MIARTKYEVLLNGGLNLGTDNYVRALNRAEEKSCEGDYCNCGRCE